MQIGISEETKIRLAGASWSVPSKLLTDEEIRKRDKNEFSPEELTQIFDRVWNDYLKQGIEESKECDKNTLRNKLGESRSRYVKPEQEQREFYIESKKLDFIVQLRHLSQEEYELNQLWFIPSSDSNPSCMYVCFENKEEKEKFNNIAEKFGYENASELALNLLKNFANTVKMHSKE